MKEQTRPITIGMTDEMIARLDDWRRTQEDLPSRPVAAKRLLERSLQRVKKIVETDVPSI